ASGGLLDNSTFADVSFSINLLITYDVIFIAASFMLFDAIVEE
ncbi:MAG: cytochrome C biogenesis protein, partial [Anaerolineales bacterium]|nr:cytochrome C biogenesis protein [Anaerolineales bacterium]